MKARSAFIGILSSLDNCNPWNSTTQEKYMKCTPIYNIEKYKGAVEVMSTTSLNLSHIKSKEEKMTNVPSQLMVDLLKQIQI